MAESNRKGSFWLFEAGQRSLDATWELYQNNTQYGWFAAGQTTPTVVSTVDRIDFANDSPTAASPRGPIPTARAALSGVGNANYGWFGGGYGLPGMISSIERIQYSNDSPASAGTRGPLSQARGGSGATGNNYYGWFGGGQTFTPIVVYSIVERIDFANDSPSAASRRGPLNAAKSFCYATGNSYYGWFAGGQLPAVTSTVERIDFANDSPTGAGTRGPLSTIRFQASAAGNSNYGWFGGGGSPGTSSIVERIDWSNDSPTAASRRGPLSAVRNYLSALGNANYGWWGGGSAPATTSVVERIDYSNDTTTASPRGPLSLARSQIGATAGIAVYGTPPIFLSTSTLLTPVANYGWWAGGYSGGQRSTVDRIDFANDSPTTASARGFLTTSQNGNGATSNNYYGWVNQGNTSIVDRIEMSNDLVTSTPRGSIPHPGGNLQDRAAAGNANFGWHSGGGTPGGRRSTIDRINYANDTSASVTRGPLPSDRYAHAATSNANFGWHAGGNPGIAQITRIDYSNDSPAATGNRGSFPSANEELAGTGNANYGWFSGGSIGAFRSTIYRVDYSNDLVNATLRALLTKNRSNFRGSGNSRFGWVGPGNNGDSSIDRIDYSNDTANASARGNLSQTRYTQASFSNYVAQPETSTASPAPAFYVAPYAYGGSTVGTSGSANYGWYGHGYSPGSVSSVDRVDFANDTTAASPRGALPTATFSSDTVGNQNYGWWAGGYSGTSATARVDFSNDGVAATVRGFLSAIRFRGGSVSNSNYGWVGFGQPSGSPAPTSIDRIDFSNESPTAASRRGTASIARTDEPGSVGNANYGWFGGGTVGSSAIERIDFANDSPTIAASRGFMSRLKGGISSSGNAAYGWFALGYDLSTNIYSSIDRLDFSNDTITNQVRSNGSDSKFWSSGSGNINYGWHGGGLPTPTTYTSRIERLDYANDTNGNSQTRSNFTVNRGANAAISNYVK